MENRPVKIKLKNKHLVNCKLVSTRSELIKQLPKNLICAEVGVAFGEFSQKIYNIMKPKELYLIDIWKSERYKKGYEFVKEKFSECPNVHLVKECSIKALESFPKESFDFIYIDTHSFKTTYSELITSSHLLKKNGYLAGHDYSSGNIDKSLHYGVIQAVHSFCLEYNWQFKYLSMETNSKSFCLQRIDDAC